MNGHDEYLELLAASIDFGLTEEEVARLNYHLASCPECRRAATELRGQNAVIATTPIAPLAPARSEQILRAALRKPATKPRWGMLAVAALLATLGGGVLFAGVQLITDDDPAPDQSPPIVAEVSAPPSELPAEESVDPGAPPPVDGPRVTPNPGDDEPPPPADPAKLAFPLPYTTELGMIRVAPAADDRLWVSVGRGRETVLALLDSDGRPLQGWPMSLPFAEDCYPLAAPTEASGSSAITARMPRECADVCGEDRVFAFSARRAAADGLPQVVPGRICLRDRPPTARAWSATGSSWPNTRAPTTSLIHTVSARSRRSGRTATWLSGARVPAPENCCTIGPTASAYGTTLAAGRRKRPRSWPSTRTACGQAGRSQIEGEPSMPAFGPDGELLFSVRFSRGRRVSRIVRLATDGSPAAAPIDPGVTIIVRLRQRGPVAAVWLTRTGTPSRPATSA